MSIKIADTYLDRMAAKAAANPAKAAIFQAKVDAKIAAWIAAGKTVTNDGATITSYTIPTSSSGGGSSSTSTTGQTFTLTTSVDSIPGLNGSRGSASNAGDDTISGLFGSGNTLSIGDNLDGGSGTDTLNIIGIESTALPFVSLDSVENVNIRLLNTTAAPATANAVDWSGVAVLSNASSLADTQLVVSGLAQTTKVALYGETQISAQFANLTSTNSAESVTVAVVGAGSAASADASYATVLANGAVGILDLDEDDGGLLDRVVIQSSGSSTNWVTLEGGADLRMITVQGSAALKMATDDLITTFDASAASAAIDVTLNGASDVAAKGGSSADTFRFGTTLTNGDSVNGGAGSDTVTFTIGSFNRSLNTTAVEIATINFTDAAGGVVDMGDSTVATINIFGGSASADASVSEIVNGATINLTASADALDEVTLDAASGATTMTINFGSASGSTNISGLSVADAANVTINFASNSTGTNTLASAVFDSDTKALTINTLGGDADVSMTALSNLGGVTALTISTLGSAGFALSSAIEANNTSLRVVTLNANESDAADITFNNFTNSTGLATVTLNANSGADIYGSGIEFGNGASAGASTYVLNLAADTNSQVGTAASNQAGIVLNTTGVANLTVNIDASSASATVHVGGFSNAVGSASASATDFVLSVSAGTLGVGSIVRTESANFAATFTGQQINIGTVNLGASSTLALFSGGLAASGIANLDISAITLNMGASSIAEMFLVSGIETTAGAVGAITISAADAASATFGAIEASSLGAISVTVASGASATFGNLLATAGTIGAITIGGVDGAGVEFGTLGGSAIGNIRVSGALDVTLGTMTFASAGTIDASQMTNSGTFTADLSGVTQAVEVSLGSATNVIISGEGNDVITLKAGVTGNDTIRFTSTGEGVDDITGFFAGSTGQDVLSFVAGAAGVATAGIFDGDGSAQAATNAIDLSVVINGTGASATLTETDNIIVFGTAFATTAAMQAFMNTGIIFASAAIATAGFICVWSDGNNAAYISYVDAVDAGSAGATTLSSASHTLSTTTLAVLNGVTPGQLNAANFTFV